MLGTQKMQRFVGVGIFVAIFQFATFWVLFQVSGQYLLASIIAFVFTVLVSFFLQGQFVFQVSKWKEKKIGMPIIYMYLNALLGLLINAGIMYVGVELVFNSPELWQIVSMAFLACFNYLIYGLIFKRLTT